MSDRAGSVLFLLLCLTSTWSTCSDGRIAGSECNTSSWTGVWMVKNGEFGCFRCDKGERWNRDGMLCEKCDGELTSCESNVFHGACSKASCDNEENTTATGQPISTPTGEPPTVTNPTDHEPTTVEGIAVGSPTLRMPTGANPATPISENPTGDEGILHTKMHPPVKDPGDSEDSRLVIGLSVGLGIVTIVIIIVIGFVIKKYRRESQSTKKDNGTDVEPGGTESSSPLMEEQYTVTAL